MVERYIRGFRQLGCQKIFHINRRYLVIRLIIILIVLFVLDAVNYSCEILFEFVFWAADVDIKIWRWKFVQKFTVFWVVFFLKIMILTRTNVCFPVRESTRLGSFVEEKVVLWRNRWVCFVYDAAGFDKVVELTIGFVELF